MHRLRLDGAVLIDLGDVRLSTTICHVCVLFIRVYTYIYTHTHAKCKDHILVLFLQHERMREPCFLARSVKTMPPCRPSARVS